VEPVVKTSEDYVLEVANRLGDLSIEEAQGLLDLNNTPQLTVISKVLGPEVSGVLNDVIGQIAGAMANPRPTQEAAMPMAKGGLVSRRKKPVAKKK
jgi:hypothetical protein